MVMPNGKLPVGGLAVGTGNSVKVPPVVMRPILLLDDSVNQRAPSGPVVMSSGTLTAVGMSNSVKVPSEVIRPILLPWVNQRAPSGPVVMPSGPLSAVGR